MTSGGSIRFTWLNGPDIARLAMTDGEILAAVEGGLLAQGRGQTVIEPRMHLTPDPAFRGHFNVLRGYVAPLSLAGVKIVGDYVDNWQKGLPSEMALLNLFDPRTGMPVAILDATAITEMRTGALTALGARHLARKDSKILGHVGARGTSYWNIRLLDHLFSFDEIRVHSRRKESREAFAETLARDLGKKIIVTEDWRNCLEGADIMVEASRLETREETFKTSWIGKGACVIPYGTVSALELSMMTIMDKIVIDDFSQFRAGKFGALRPHIDAGLVSEETVHGELCEIIAGKKPGRVRDDETILFWHRGLSLSDIALGAAMLEKAKTLGIGQTLTYA
ncbi:ornithine cyclodeaminase family protein [Nordella sp. HKS 07]|uniref:ornithine cyclodeaminase family protein n=1 Tax=Nordella sp. HKS 07 TaxID=2712222 RepID=UPI0013E13FA5|nr:ornithine cyclodeaminase family protein [Nordella sp. HKS 07]QIG47524.1 ornithine cyclodeaminase family protein [Nordella sp. HKS 07]